MPMAYNFKFLIWGKSRPISEKYRFNRKALNTLETTKNTQASANQPICADWMTRQVVLVSILLKTKYSAAPVRSIFSKSLTRFLTTLMGCFHGVRFLIL